MAAAPEKTAISAQVSRQSVGVRREEARNRGQRGVPRMGYIKVTTFSLLGDIHKCFQHSEVRGLADICGEDGKLLGVGTVMGEGGQKSREFS